MRRHPVKSAMPILIGDDPEVLIVSGLPMIVMRGPVEEADDDARDVAGAPPSGWEPGQPVGARTDCRSRWPRS
jgi:hypothetical protein